MLRLEYKLSLDDCQFFLDSLDGRLDYDYYFSPKCFTYKHQFTFKCKLSSFTVLCEFNGTTQTRDKIVIVEFNPNKVGQEISLLQILKTLSNLARRCRIVRFDVASDIQVARNHVFMVQRDQRTYSCYKNSSLDCTEYLGHRNKHAFVKVYNKALEQDCNDKDLTRIEVTVEWERHQEYKFLFPVIYVLGDFQTDLEFNALSGTDKVLVLACLDNHSYLDMLSRNKREKIKQFIATHSSIISPDLVQYQEVCKLAEEYLYRPHQILNNILNSD